MQKKQKGSITMERLTRTLLYIAMGTILAFAIYNKYPDDIFVAIMAFGVPGGYSFIGRHFGHICIITYLPYAMIFFLLKLMISGLIGWIVLPLELIYGMFQAILEFRIIRRIINP